jgi:16S rRNA (adenine1518-N6/adenine1519-N6)-dimethyltransferase
MPLYRPKELIAFLSSLGVSPKEQLSQNFLIDGNIVKKIVTFAHITSQDTVVEIGPGPGVLTEQLLEAGASVIAVEKDPIFAKALERLDPKKEKLRTIVGDFLDIPFSDLVPSGRRIKVVANIPYSLTTPILEKLLASSRYIVSCTLMVQDEVARRLVAKKKTPQYRAITILAGYHAELDVGFLVPPSCFFPRPHVNSKVIGLHFQKRWPVEHEKAFFDIIKEAFCHRRKMLHSSLSPLFDSETIKAALRSLNLPEGARPEELSCEEWCRFFQELSKK